jgi:hypothetical protein
VSRINDSSAVKLSIALLHFTEAITMLAVKPNRQYHHYLDTPDDGPFPVSAMTEYEIFLFMALTIQRNTAYNKLTDYWTTIDQFYKPFYSNMIKRDRFLQIPCFLQFSHSRNEIGKMDENYDCGKHDMYLEV